MFDRWDRIPPTRLLQVSRGVSFGLLVPYWRPRSVFDRCCSSSAPSSVPAMPSIQSFSISSEALNEHGTFSEGDVLRGKVTLALTKQITVESMFIKVTGDATVRWTKRVGDRSYTYSAAHRYFKLKQPLILALAKGRW